MLLKLIGKYLRAGLMQNGVETVRTMGTPQGGPLSTLLSNILWDRLKLIVSETKSKEYRPWKCKFPGYSMTLEKNPRLRVAPESCRKFRNSLKEVFRRGRGRKITDTIAELNPKLQGWFNYFRYAQNKGMFQEIDGRLRNRFRCVIWRQWKKPNRRRLELIRRGIEPERAKISEVNGFGPWWNANASHMKQAFSKRFFDETGLVALSDLKMSQTIQSETAVYGTVRTVV